MLEFDKSYLDSVLAFVGLSVAIVSILVTFFSVRITMNKQQKSHFIQFSMLRDMLISQSLQKSERRGQPE